MTSAATTAQEPIPPIPRNQALVTVGIWRPASASSTG